jgi:heat shock protein HspQ
MKIVVSKFGLGQRVYQQLTGVSGVVIDIDSCYSLEVPAPEEVANNEAILSAPWYYVVLEGETGETVQTYMPEFQLAAASYDESVSNSVLEDIAFQVKEQLTAPRLLH